MDRLPQSAQTILNPDCSQNWGPSTSSGLCMSARLNREKVDDVETLPSDTIEDRRPPKLSGWMALPLVKTVQDVRTMLIYLFGNCSRCENKTKKTEYFDVHLRPPPIRSIGPLIRLKF
jgi:hypothetical protein